MIIVLGETSADRLLTNQEIKEIGTGDEVTLDARALMTDVCPSARSSVITGAGDVDPTDAVDISTLFFRITTRRTPR